MEHLAESVARFQSGISALCDIAEGEPLRVF